MNQEELQYCMLQLSGCSGIPLILLDGDGEPGFCTGWGSRHITADIYREQLEKLRGLWGQKKLPVTLSVAPGILYGYLRGDQGCEIILGPCEMRVLSPSERYDLKKKLGAEEKGFVLPAARSEQCMNVLRLLNYMMTGAVSDRWQEGGSIPVAAREQEKTEAELAEYYRKHPDELQPHLTYAYEQRLWDAVAAGDEETFRALGEQVLLENTGPVAEDHFKELEYLAVSGITLFTRAVIRGGVPEYYSYALSDALLRRLEKADSVPAIEQVMVKTQDTFFDAVRRAKQERSRDRDVEKCRDYIAQHLHTGIRVDEMAEDVGMNRSSLSRKFRAVEGMSLREYIAQEKVRAAENLLRYSDVPIAEVADWLRFGSQSAFGKTFRKVTGMTPGQYRGRYGQAGGAFDAAGENVQQEKH